MADVEILGLPANRPELWGDVICRLAERVLPPEASRRSALPYLAAFLTGGKDKYFSSLHHWVREGVFNEPKKQMTAEHWLNIVRYFWRRPGGLTCREEVEALSRCGGRYLEQLMENKRADFERLFAIPWEHGREFAPRQMLIPPDPNYLPLGFLLKRPELDEILGVITDRWYQDSAIVIYGPPGIGKTTLLRQLLDTQKPIMDIGSRKIPLGEYFHGGALYVPMNQGLPFSLVVHDLARQAGMYAPVEHLDDAVLLYQVRDRLRGQPCILLLDGVPDVETAQRLTVVDYQTSLVIITTQYKDVARGLVPSDEMLFSLTGFGKEEARELYEKTLNRKAAASICNSLEEMALALDGNPAALAAAIRVADEFGVESTLHLIKSPPDELFPGLLAEVFKPRKLAYQRLRSDVYRLRLAALTRLNPLLSSIHEETIAAIFDVDVVVARGMLAQLNQETKLVRPLASQGDVWQVDPLARQLATDHSAQASLADWQERAIKTGYMQSYLSNKQAEAANLPIIQALLHYAQDRRRRGKSVWWLVWKLLTEPDFVPQQAWSLSRVAGLSDQEYLQSEYLARQERQDRRKVSLVLRLFLALVALLIIVVVLTVVLRHTSIGSFLWLMLIGLLALVTAFSMVAAIGLAWSAWNFDRLIDFQWMLWRKRNAKAEASDSPEERQPPLPQ